ncbi:MULTISPECIES: efflux RND transporter periplasmic adaptor subunit [Sphingomonadales]|jgi:membrane fusion protein, heavy metal efflux system|uniref:Cobalt-zinc-cadmium efflux system membrane fusion protein n=2 Tax=Sphingomonadales TaxID=204457 RepID=A0A4V3BS43_9SPHN|nr:MULTISPECIES: efflux RND transporter periplasmic adaptor subunit [Sphingomonadales]RKF17349.1 efflux RND transporter periplasmic adaptor subunit [Altericroceibacterium spongiae]TDN77978.1 cobalt-zinc-cadmium efflux system membrane fusion protein [Stakelama pacifica]GGP00493.1 metal transporter [Stakelama pacifica]
MIQPNRRILGGAGAVLLVAAGAVAVSQCTADPVVETGNEEQAEEAVAPMDTLAMTPDAIRAANIAVETVQSGGLGSEVLAQATVTASPTGEAIVTALASGAVTRVYKRLGDPVRAGEALAIVRSRDAAQIAAAKTAAEAQAVLAQRNLARERQLYQQQVSARVDYERAQAEAAVAAAEAQRARLAARAANVTGDGSGSVVASPISGRVTSENVSLGAYVQPETELFRVADPSKVQIEAAVGPTDAQRLVPGDRAVVELPDGRTIEARVRAITPGLAGETRSATAVLDVPGSLQPGLPVRVRLLPSRGEVSDAIVIPEEALQTLEGRDVVFVRTEDGFRANNVTVARRSAGRVEIASGLKTGQMIATTNAFLLKAELGKGAGEEE